MKNKYRTFSKARKFVRSLKLKSNKKWRVYCRSGKRPVDVPTNPDKIYKKEWVSWGDWFGTGTIAKYYIKYRPFSEARKFACSLKLKNTKDWREYLKSGKKPNSIPANPDVVYKNKGWKNLGDWLGTGNVRAGSIQYRSFQEARKFVRKFGFKNREEWMRYCKSGKKPADIPTSPRGSYKEFKDWGDFLGTGKIGKFTKSNTRSFKQARKFVKALKMKGQNDWFEYCKSGKKPADIPSNPQFNYKKEWTNWSNWLGTETRSDRLIVEQRSKLRPFKEARKFTRKLGFKSREEWEEYCKSGKKPDDIPEDLVWWYGEGRGWGDWLGTSFVSNRNRKFRSFKKARKFAQSLKLNSQNGWAKYCRSGKRPDDIPSNPSAVYKKEWTTWGDWFGTGTIATRQREILPYEEAEKAAHILVNELGIESHDDWLKAYREGKIPKNLPSHPWSYYKPKRRNRRKK